MESHDWHPRVPPSEEGGVESHVGLFLHPDPVGFRGLGSLNHSLDGQVLNVVQGLSWVRPLRVALRSQVWSLYQFSLLRCLYYWSWKNLHDVA